MWKRGCRWAVVICLCALFMQTCQTRPEEKINTACGYMHILDLELFWYECKEALCLSLNMITSSGVGETVLYSVFLNWNWGQNLVAAALIRTVLSKNVWGGNTKAAITDARMSESACSQQQEKKVLRWCRASKLKGVTVQMMDHHRVSECHHLFNINHVTLPD